MPTMSEFKQVQKYAQCLQQLALFIRTLFGNYCLFYHSSLTVYRFLRGRLYNNLRLHFISPPPPSSSCFQVLRVVYFTGIYLFIYFYRINKSDNCTHIVTEYFDVFAIDEM